MGGLIMVIVMQSLCKPSLPYDRTISGSELTAELRSESLIGLARSTPPTDFNWLQPLPPVTDHPCQEDSKD